MMTDDRNDASTDAMLKLIAVAPDMLRVVRRLATCDWMGEAELSLWVKECRDIMRKIETNENTTRDAS